MRASSGVILDVWEWTDDDAIAQAHETPEVLELWKRFEACSDYVKLDTLEEIHLDFAAFDAVNL